MTQEIKIGIVEDELLIAEKIKTLLANIGYNTCEPVCSYDDAMKMISSETPDLLLLDINLGVGKDGIEIAKKINEQYHLPFIFLTANSDGDTLERAKEVKPCAYLVKPFTKEELFVSIEIAFNNFSAAKKENTPKNAGIKDCIFIKDNHRFIKISFQQIAYVESRENYVVIHTSGKKSTTLRSTFNEFLAQLPAEKFFRVHRSYAVQTDLIENIEPTELLVAGAKVPLSSSYREGLFSFLGIK